MSKYIVEGGYPIHGEITASGNKNAALPALAAALLSREDVILRRVPEIADVKLMLNIIEQLGAEVEHIEAGCYRINAANLTESVIPPAKSRLIRAAILFAAPLLARLGEVKMAPPGGDNIGRRRVDTHFLIFKALGARVEITDEYSLTCSGLTAANIFLDEASVTATENGIMAAVVAEGSTTIYNAACEPHIQNLCHMLRAMGAGISGIGSNLLHIEGVKQLSGCDFTIGSDFMEIGSLVGLTAVTRGQLAIKKCNPPDLRMIRMAFGKLGIEWRYQDDVLLIDGRQRMRVNNDIGGMIPRIDDAPWPGFPADLTSIMTVVASQVEGTVLIHEKLFESRMFFVDKLIAMRAKIILCDPHRAVVSGPSKLIAAELVSPDVRAGMSMVIAAMCAEGRSIIHNIYQIERGYEDLAGRLTSLGGCIKRVDDGKSL